MEKARLCTGVFKVSLPSALPFAFALEVEPDDFNPSILRNDLNFGMPDPDDPDPEFELDGEDVKDGAAAGAGVGVGEWIVFPGL